MAHKRSVTARQRNQVGVTFFESGALDLAIEQFTLAIKNAPWVATYWRNLGIALLDRGEIDQAQTMLEKSLKLNAQSQSTYFHLAQIHTKRKHDLSARVAYQKVIDLDAGTHLAGRAREFIEGWRPHLIVEKELRRRGE